MSFLKPRFFGKLKPRERRLLLYLAPVLVLAAWKFIPRPWHPTQLVDTAHYKIYSTATTSQVAATAHAMELLYVAYSNRLAGVSGCQNQHPLLQIKLYKDRDELRRINPGLGWAEAFYKNPYCRAYFSADEKNPYHWMLHECVHQLNEEVAHLKLAKWLDEGLADYFGTSRLMAEQLAVGDIDLNTYPVWWIDNLATASNLADNLKNGSVIPLRAIITDHGGPSLDQNFNLYYLHWWTLTHFLFESEKYRDRVLQLTAQGGRLEDFEKIIGPVDQVQLEWHTYVRHLKTVLTEKEFILFKQRKVQKPARTSVNVTNGH
jgi:hypothetical protein